MVNGSTKTKNIKNKKRELMPDYVFTPTKDKALLKIEKILAKI
jgi:hypothetical protein